MSIKKIPRSCGTHDGTFHADEVTACALLILFNLIDSDKIVRTRCRELLDRCEFVCDVGGRYDSENKLFDHHQVEYQGSMSSAGMILLYLKETDVITNGEYVFFNNSLILGVDAHDNGKDPQIPGLCSYSHLIASFVPVIYDVDPVMIDEAFFVALEFSKEHLNRLLNRYRYTRSCRQTVVEVMERDKECLMFDKNLPWLESFFEFEGAKHPALFVIMPSGQHWKLRGIPPTYEQRMQVRLQLPQEWAGLLNEDLQKASGIPGAIFCHKGRFISVWETREDAMKALQHILSRKKKG